MASRGRLPALHSVTVRAESYPARAQKDAMDVEDGAAGDEEEEQMDNPLANTNQGLDGDAT